MFGMMAMMGAAGFSYPEISIVSSRTVIQPNTAIAAVDLMTDGEIQKTGSGSGDSWVNPIVPGIGDRHWARLTHNSGSVPTGSPLNTWLQLNINRGWSISRSQVGQSTSQCTLQISTDASGSIIVATRSMTLTASVEL